MVKSQELIYLFAIFIALISLSRCSSFVTVNVDEAVQLDFPYPCDSNIVTVQIANRLPFYISTDTANLHLPNYQLHRFSVTDGNCSVQVQINPVKRSDEATYIGKAYRDGVIRGRFTKIRLNVNYPPGDASCTWGINDGAFGNWVPLQCTAPVGSLAGGIFCYQDSKKLPPKSKLVQTGETLKQTIWVLKEVHPVFCCSVILDRPKDMCDCNDFVWEPSYTEKILNPCPVTTAGHGAITEGPVERSTYLFVTDTVNPSTSKTYSNDVKSNPSVVRAIWIVLLILVTSLFIIKFYCFNKKTITNSSPEEKEEHPETNILVIKVQESESSPHSSKTQTKLEEEPINGGTSVL